MGIAIRPSTRRMRKATRRFVEWQNASALAAAPIAPTRKMQRVKQRQVMLQGKAATTQAAVATVLARRAAAKARRPALLRWTPLLNRRERKLNIRVASLQAQERAEGNVFRSLEAAKKAALTADAKQREEAYKRADARLAPKLTTLKKRYTQRIANIQRLYGGSMYASLNPRQQAKLAGWFTDAMRKINGISNGTTLIMAHALLADSQEYLRNRDYRRAARMLYRITQL
ncbi:MAG: hypothetical protein IPJ89_04460 [Candidatus Iainarchaeum archaeon]|uniref:Uncharacterized protein n=1 Tax=Candidatus Iainarchaeum sp. TaxID=3101447 RepID=A0A7T9DJG8_9ARCH|nr:MAG: hypothetical protein IPJ89_04460 [Candidatus Diapherotrites archaeon]